MSLTKSENIFEYDLYNIQKIIKFPSCGSFELIKPIEEGNFSRVFLFRKKEPNDSKNSNIFYAIKIFKKFGIQKNQEKESKIQKIFFTEICGVRTIQRIKKIQNPYLINIFDFCIDRKMCQIKVLMEAMPFDLKNYFSIEKNYADLDENLLKKISYQILSAINALHKSKIIHLNIKPENILYNPYNKIIKLTGFTFSQNINYDLTKKNLDIGGSYSYMPPESLIDTKKFSFKNDIWALGIVLLELLSKKNIFEGNDKKIVINKIFGFFGLNNPNKTKIFLDKNEIVINYIKKNKKININDNNFLDLVAKMVTLDENERISVEEALKHPLFQRLDLDSI